MITNKPKFQSVIQAMQSIKGFQQDQIESGG